MKKVCKILAGMLLLAALSVTGFAASNNSVADMTKSFTKCEACGERTLQRQPVRYSEWGFVGEVECVHEGGEMQIDEREVRLKISPYQCTNCGHEDSDVVIEERHNHKGRPKPRVRPAF